jgi:hypothetical protein
MSADDPLRVAFEALRHVHDGKPDGSQTRQRVLASARRRADGRHRLLYGLIPAAASLLVSVAWADGTGRLAPWRAVLVRVLEPSRTLPVAVVLPGVRVRRRPSSPGRRSGSGAQPARGRRGGTRRAGSGRRAQHRGHPHARNAPARESACSASGACSSVRREWREPARAQRRRGRPFRSRPNGALRRARGVEGVARVGCIPGGIPSRALRARSKVQPGHDASSART